MYMKYIDILKNSSKFTKFIRYFQDKPKVVGRWNRELSHNQLIRRIELANEDHCGPCGGLEIKKIDKLIKW